MDERQPLIPSECWQTRVARFATVVLCATLCSAVVGAVGVKPSGTTRTPAPVPTTQVIKPLEPVPMVPVKAAHLPVRKAELLPSPATPSLPALGKAAELLTPAAPAAAPTLTPIQVKPGPPLPAPRRNQRVLRMEVTAYCHCVVCCGPAAQGLTASGKPVSYNGGLFVAADTNVLPFGTKLIIPGYAGDQPVEVVDRGGAIKGYRLDVYYPSHDVAREWGRRFVNVIVLE